MDKSIKDISFLESEFLTFLLINYFLNENAIDLKDTQLHYFPVKQILLASENNEEKITIETNDFDVCKELYTALKDGKKVYKMELEMKAKEFELSVTLKTNPIRITAVKAPKSIAEDFYDRVIEREKFVEIVFNSFDFLFKSFANMRIRNDWHNLISNFKNFLEKN